MYQYLFFDDQRLLGRKNLKREIVKPELIKDSVYWDGLSSTDLRTLFVFKTDDGKYRMIYSGKVEDEHFCFMAVSTDGIHFEPEDVLGKVNKEVEIAKNALFQIEHGEIAEIVEDPYNDPDERYKMLFCDIEFDRWIVHGKIYTSPDLYNWKVKDCDEWNNYGAEPITGVIYNKERECYTITVRPDWGTRKVGYVDTKDWNTFTPYEKCLQVDSLDGPLSELYGMPCMVYNNYYIGFPLIYRGFEDKPMTKVDGGSIEAELAYSFDGHHWQRSLREPFLTGLDSQNEDVFGYQNMLTWPSSFRIEENGDVIIHSVVSKLEHGDAFNNPGWGRICAYRVIKDRFIALSTENENEESSILTRENLWNAGELHINISCKKATVAIYETKGNDLLSVCHPIDGYSHEDCIEFSGDSTDWVPQFKTGKTLDDLKGKTITVEVRFDSGSIYSVEGDFVPSMNLQSARYRLFGTMPEII